MWRKTGNVGGTIPRSGCGEVPGPRLHKMRKEKVYGVSPSPSLFPGACISSKKAPRFPLMPLRETTTTTRAPPRWTTTSNCEPKQPLPLLLLSGAVVKEATNKPELPPAENVSFHLHSKRDFLWLCISAVASLSSPHF